jgi:hypothetical protein
MRARDGEGENTCAHLVLDLDEKSKVGIDFTRGSDSVVPVALHLK